MLRIHTAYYKLSISIHPICHMTIYFKETVLVLNLSVAVVRCCNLQKLWPFNRELFRDFNSHLFFKFPTHMGIGYHTVHGDTSALHQGLPSIPPWLDLLSHGATFQSSGPGSSRDSPKVNLWYTNSYSVGCVYLSHSFSQKIVQFALNSLIWHRIDCPLVSRLFLIRFLVERFDSALFSPTWLEVIQCWFLIICVLDYYLHSLFISSQTP